MTKLAAEHLCAVYAANWGLPTVSLRYFTVFGPRQRPDMSIHRLCESALGGDAFPRYGDGSQIREFTYVSDIVAGNLAAAAADVAPGTTVNLAGGGEITLADLIVMVGELAGSPVAVEARPSRARRFAPQRRCRRPRSRAARLGTARVVARRHRRPTRLAPRAARALIDHSRR